MVHDQNKLTENSTKMVLHKIQKNKTRITNT